MGARLQRTCCICKKTFTTNRGNATVCGGNCRDVKENARRRRAYHAKKAVKS